MQTYINEYIDNREKHEDYYSVMEEYIHTELCKEIIHFMNIAFPEWKTNKGVGFYAGEFILHLLINNEYLQDRNDFSQREMLINLYNEIVIDYFNFKESYVFVFREYLNRKFNIDYAEVLEEQEHLEYKDFSALYDLLFEEFKLKEQEQITYNFEDDLILK